MKLLLLLCQALGMLLAWGTLCICLVSSEESASEGLTSTSLVEFAMMSHLEPLDSNEQTSPETVEPELVPSALHASPGSGFASEENEESKILQPPQYFWEDGGELNDSSLDLGPATGSQAISEDPFEMTSRNTGVMGAGVELTESTATAELGNPTAEAGGELTQPTMLTGMEQTEEAPEITASPGGGPPNTKAVSESPPGSWDLGSPSAPWDSADSPAPTPALNSTKLVTTLVMEDSFALQTEDSPAAVMPTEMPWNSPQVICKDWSNLAGKNYIILNMSDNIDCEEFRLERGPQLLALVEDAFSKQTDGLQGQWLISLSKPNENDKHLLMTLAGEQGVIPTKDVLTALGDVKRSLAEIGIQNYTTTTSCQSRPSQPRSDYGKLFVVLVIIGSICAIIIILGLIYNCWQRRLPKMKNMSHGEELRFVENGCHDNPTLDVASDSQSEMQEKKPSLNGGSAINGPDSWDVLISKQASEDTDVFEEDTHL
ncbi:PREDICTED: podocalyxin-like protein 2 isoform X2 [Crocodylus porosus]|uniref:podocalyxin-like protein 2 isoform X2 n=1 Tax=Crocodylus porosus TaxID=8502 RepID=UPI00093F028B|nr:PREDICTED: podocalyxin-like protein 2 isoform X2 [Crocodylus porosus]